MSISPMITFKAGRCVVDQSSKPYKVSPVATKGYIYLYSEDDLIHFCWRERGAQVDDPEDDLVMVPTDGQFMPYEPAKDDRPPTSKANGRLFVLKFSSSSARHMFWLQSKPQSRNGDATWFSPRDLKIGQLVNALLQGDEVDVTEEIAPFRDADGGDDDDATMSDVEGLGNPSEHHRGGSGSGGAGADATGGDVREEGSQARDGGADGGRAGGPGDAASVVQNFLKSLQGNANLASGSGSQQAGGQAYTTLPDLLPSSTTIPTIDDATPAELDNLLSYLPPSILLIAQESASQTDGMVEPSAGSAAAALEALSIGQKKQLIKRVLRSPQLNQSLGSLTMAIRDGGLPSIGEALGVELRNGGLVRGGNVPLGGGDAVEAFVEGMKSKVEKEK